MRRVIFLTIGWICAVAGAVVTPLPPPFAFGLPLLFFGLYLLALNSKWSRRGMQRLRERYPDLSGKIEDWRGSSIPQVRQFVRMTAPQSLRRRARLKAFRAARRRRRRRGRSSLPVEPSP